MSAADLSLACDEVIASLDRCAAADCGISRGADVDLERALCAEDPTMLREAARRVRRETPAMRAQARGVEVWRRAFWLARGVDPDASPFGGG